MSRESRTLTPRAIEIGALGIAAVGVALLVWPARAAVPPYNRAMPSALAVAAATPDDYSARDSIVATNLFSGSRRAPRERFRLPGTEVFADPTPVAPLPGADVAPDAGPQLFGLVVVDGTPRALIQIARDSAPRLVAVGEVVGRWRVQQIGADRAVLSSSMGTRIVRLSRRAPSDSGGLLP